MSAIDKATRLPLQIARTNDTAHRLVILDACGVDLLTIDIRDEMDERALAALIVKAVNLFEAHEAVVKMAEDLIRDGVGLCELAAALESLSTLREKEGV